MKLILGTIALLIFIILLAAPVRAQEITVGPDSVRVPVVETVALADTAEKEGFFLSRWNKPQKAAFYSAVLPGLGQAYNKAYWKIPIIYATGAVLGYFLVTNNNTYQDLRTALLIRNDNDSTTIDDFSNHPTLGEGYPSGDRNLRFNRDTFRRNRDVTILLSVLAYGLNVAEAYVHAHLKEFDVSDNLSMRFTPNLMSVPGTATTTPGLTLTLFTKYK